MKLLSPVFKQILIGAMLIWSASFFAHGEQIPIQAWVHDPVIDSVRISPDGTKMAALTLPSVTSPPEITIWSLERMKEPPLRFSPKRSKALALDWVSNHHLIVVGRQKEDTARGGKVIKWFNTPVYLYKVDSDFIENRSTPKERLLSLGDDVIGASLENILRKKPNIILLRVTNREFASDLYEMNLNTFRLRRVYRGSPKNSVVTNLDGEVIGKVTFRARGIGARLEYSYRNPDTGKFEVHHEFVAKDREGLQPVGFGSDGRTIYMTDNRETDKAVIRTYDLITRELSEPLYGGKDIEAISVNVSSDLKDYGELISYVGYGVKTEREFVSQTRKKLQQLVDDALGEEQDNSIISLSDDWSKIIVRTNGVKEPGSFYLLLNQQQLVPLGSRFPGLKSENLNAMEYIEYQARDGLTIPAFLTLPQYSEAPYPTVIMPHGGPWARDFLAWDRWAQFLANRGYAVLQPQYRGSQGWGHKLWRAGDREWGQKMQDDKDDGAAWMVEQGLAAKDRIAMFGYSYGGYAAMAAVVRPNSPYQCAISGAGLSELRSFDKITFENPLNRDFQNPTIAGLSPLDHAKQATIPLYIFHGDRDQRVPIIQSRKYYKALKRAGKDVEYNEVPDLWHSLPWWPTHHVNMLENLEDYLKNRCGPDGL